MVPPTRGNLREGPVRFGLAGSRNPGHPRGNRRDSRSAAFGIDERTNLRRQRGEAPPMTASADIPAKLMPVQPLRYSEMQGMESGSDRELITFGGGCFWCLQ